MVPICLKTLENFIYELVSAAGMDQENAKVFTDVYMRATLRDVGHHDIYDISSRISAFYSKTMNPNPQIQLTAKYEALESYDGNNGPGELCSSFIMERGTELAEKYGIGFCTIKNSNHFLSAAPYVEKAAEDGYFAMIFTRVNPCMGMSGSNKKLIGNAPMGFSTETDLGFPFMLDLCLAYASYGNLKAFNASNQKIPEYWGADAQGNATSDPGQILQGGTPYSVGGHKGFALAMVVEILTGVLSCGQVIDEQNASFEKGAGVYSQSAIVIKADGLVPMETYKERMSAMINRLNAIEPGIRIPGQSSYEKKKKLKKEGNIALTPELINKVNGWAEKLGIRQLK